LRVKLAVRLLVAIAAAGLCVAVNAAGRAAAPSERSASPEPEEAQLAPVDPAWRAAGWRAVVPHAYVLRQLEPARERPDASSPATLPPSGRTRCRRAAMGCCRRRASGPRTALASTSARKAKETQPP